MTIWNTTQIDIVSEKDVPTVSARQTELGYFLTLTTGDLRTQRVTLTGDRDTLDSLLHQMLRALDNAAATIPNHPSLEGFTPRATFDDPETDSAGRIVVVLGDDAA